MASATAIALVAMRRTVYAIGFRWTLRCARTDPDRVIEALAREPATHVSYLDQPGEPSSVVRLGEISLVSAADEGCVSPVAYVEARRTGALDRATRDALDPQMQAVDPAILEVRPRFAPRTR
jgi:hypothetical protein